METAAPEIQSLFYGSLCLLGFFSHLYDDKDNDLDGLMVGGSSKNRDSWHDWLDNLALLIDQPTSSATAIAVQRSANGLPIYWVAGKDEFATNKSVLHLEWIFKELQSGATGDEFDAVGLTFRIAERSLIENAKKIRQYQRRLQKNLQTVDSGGKSSLAELRLTYPDRDDAAVSTSDAVSSQYFDDLLSLQGPAELGLAAYEFRNTKHRAWLKDKIRSSNSASVWSSIRHHIGRLGSWFKASKAIVEIYQSDRTLLSGNKVVTFLHTHRSFELPQKTIDLKAILRFIAPDFDAEQLEARLTELCKSDRGEFSAIFKERWIASQPFLHPHAEAALLEYFWLNDLLFWGPRKYIGCSKYSCYCCDRYIRLLTGGELHRPCHGNAWVQWIFPSSGVHTGAKQKLRQSVFEQLTSSVRQECLSKIIKGGKWGGRKPDSTTGITSL